jgi:LAO/AO transport system kinase
VALAPEDLAKRVAARDPEAIGAALDQVEDTRESARAGQTRLLTALARATPEDHTIVGLTGAPGAGKSTLAAALIQHWVHAGSGVGMVAIDPSSPRSRGALLGDRMRIRIAPGEPVFIRSLAARDQLGGLAPAARAAAAVLRSAFAWTLVETVGVGQSELDVATLADSVVLVVQPGAGDTLQFMKAGIVEIPDLFAVSKWDLGAVAERTRADLESVLAMLPGPERAAASRGEEWVVPVVGTAAQSGMGIPELAEQIARHRSHLAASGRGAERRIAARTAWALELFVRRYGSLGLECVGGAQAAHELARSAPGTALDAFSALATRAGLESTPGRDSSRAAARRSS